MKRYLIKILFSIFVFLLALEVLLRISNKYETRSEHRSGYYSYRYRVERPTWYYTNKPNTSRVKKEQEWQYYNQYNEFGNREKRVSYYTNDTSTIKIVCLGDSFTEGDGAPYDSSWVRQFERRLRANNKNKYSIYNAGACGSDVFYNHRILCDKLLAIRPSIVIECLNSTDVSDVIWRGGAERFNADGTVSGKVGPSWELLYKYSHLFRAGMAILYKHNENLIHETDLMAKEKNAASLIVNQIEKTAAFCSKQHIKYYLLLHPIPDELKRGSKQPVELIKQLRCKSYATSLFHTLEQFYSVNSLEKDYWIANKHYNSSGYKNMGNIIFEQLSLNLEK
jgi:hypothetical protein